MGSIKTQPPTRFLASLIIEANTAVPNEWATNVALGNPFDNREIDRNQHHG